jgi:hypothetical protein
MGYPSLFADGVDLWPISTWRPYINNRVTQPSPFSLVITGDYESANNTGTINASFQNDSTAAITARVYFVITEDSLYHVDPNGHAWHNHLARAFLPDHIGEQVTVNPGQVVDINRAFTIDPSWDENRCHIVTWIQADPPSRNVFQAGEVDIIDLVGIEENKETEIVRANVSLVSNPTSASNVRFLLGVPQGTQYRLEFFDVAGRNIKTVSGIAANDNEIVHYDLNQGGTARVNAGVYLYRFTSSILNANGKIIVR